MPSSSDLNHPRCPALRGPSAVSKSQESLSQPCYVPEDRIRQGLVIGQPIGSNIILSTISKVLNRLGLIDIAERTRQVRDRIKALNIKVSNPDLQIETLSGGNQQKVVIARWLATKPKVLTWVRSASRADDFPHKIGYSPFLASSIKSLLYETDFSLTDCVPIHLRFGCRSVV
jgi:ABC transporter